MINVEWSLKTTYSGVWSTATPFFLQTLFSSWVDFIKAQDGSNTRFLQCLSSKAKGSVKC